MGLLVKARSGVLSSIKEELRARDVGNFVRRHADYMAKIEQEFRNLLAERDRKRSESPRPQEVYEKDYDSQVKAQFKELQSRLTQEKEERRRKKELLDKKEAEKLLEEIEAQHRAEENRQQEAKQLKKQKLGEMREKGKRREVRRLLAARSRDLLDAYRRGDEVEHSVCPLYRAVVAAEDPPG